MVDLYHKYCDGDFINCILLYTSCIAVTTSSFDLMLFQILNKRVIIKISDTSDKRI